MNSYSRQLSPMRNRPPRPVEISSRLIFLLGKDNILSLAVDAVQNCKGRGIEHNRFSSCLGIRQKQQPTLEIDVLPLEMKDLAKASMTDQPLGGSGDERVGR